LSRNVGKKLSLLDASLMIGQRMGMIGCPETSVRNYHYSMRL